MNKKKQFKPVKQALEGKEEICSVCGQKFIQRPYAILCDFLMENKPKCQPCIDKI